MAQPKVPEANLARAVEIVNEVYAAGYRPGAEGTLAQAAERCVAEGLFSATPMLWPWLARARQRLGLTPDETRFRQARYQQPVAKRLLFIPDPPAFKPSGPKTRVLVIPDRHNDPRHPHRLEVTKWIARYGSEHRHDHVVCLGDDGTWDSCSRYDRNDTLKGRHKPGIRDDMDNFEAQEATFERNRAPDWKPRKHRCRGNHNQRLFDFENQHPETEDTHTRRYMEIGLQFGWKERDFGEIFYIDGIGFTHAPFNGMGKAMGGKTATHRAGALLCRSLVHGHTHSFEVHNAAKLDPIDRVTVIQAGCALPDGEVEHYATHNPTGWSHGVLDLTIEAGEITDLAFVSMKTLRARFSDDGADVAA